MQSFWSAAVPLLCLANIFSLMLTLPLPCSASRSMPSYEWFIMAAPLSASNARESRSRYYAMELPSVINN